MTHLSLSLLGTFRVTLDDKPVTTFKSDKVRALLAYLAVEADRPHRRDVLAGLLWPEVPNQNARSNLRYTLYNLRSVLGDRTATPPYLLINRDTIQFNTASDYQLDVTDMQHQINTGRRLVTQSSTQAVALQHLQSALRLYRGEFLAGFSLGDGPSFEEWTLLKREQITHQVSLALRILAQLYERRKSYTEAQHYLRQLLELEPWNEQARRDLMRVLALDGQRNAALSQYEQYCHLLDEELGVAPEQETTRLYYNIRNGTTPHSRTRYAKATWENPPSALEKRPARFVERNDELARLNTFLQATLQGQGQIAFIVGDAGSGKTALIDEFIWQTMRSHPSVTIASGNCNAHTGIGDPYLPFREMLQMLTADFETKRINPALKQELTRRLWDIFPETVQVLAEMGPGLIGRLIPGDSLRLRAEAFLPPSKGLAKLLSSDDHARADQASLFEQVTNVLQALSRQHPLLLVLDDLQWADAGSISLLFHLGKRLHNAAILLIGAYRPGDLIAGREGKRHPLAPIVHELQRDHGNIKINLNQSNGRQFVDALLDTSPNHLSETFRETFYRHTDGNPLFAVELLHGLQERGDLVPDEHGYWIESPTLHWEQLPARVEAVIAERLARLPSAGRRALTVASVEGETFTAEVVARVLNKSETVITRYFSEVLGRQHHLICPLGLQRLGNQRTSRYRFRHYLFQKYLYWQLDDVERAQIHEAVGSTLETLYGEHASAEALAAIAGQLAWHFEAAGLPDKAVSYLYRAGEHAAQMSAHQEALRHYTRGLELLRTLPSSPSRAQRELSFQLALGVPLRAIKSYGTPERGQAYKRAMKLSQQLGDPSRIFQALLLQWSYCMPRAEHQKSLGIAQQVLMLAEQLGNSAQTATAHTALGMSLTYLGEFLAAREHFEQALIDYDPQQRRSLLSLIGQDVKVTSLAYLSWVLWLLGYPDQALQRVGEAIAMARSLGQPFSIGFALGIAGGVIHLRCGDYQTARAEAEELSQLGKQQRFALYQAWGKCILGRALTELGQPEAGLASLREGVTTCKSIGVLASHTQQLANFVEACVSAGQFKEGLDAISEALALVEATDERHFEANLYLRWGELLLRQSPAHWDEAQDHLHHAIAIAQQQQAKSWELRAVTLLSQLWQRQGHIEQARRLLADTLAWFNEGFNTVDLRMARAQLDILEA